MGYGANIQVWSHVMLRMFLIFIEKTCNIDVEAGMSQRLPPPVEEAIFPCS
jgi:hypothetical protein